MTRPRHALVVSRSAPQRARLQHWLIDAGFRVTVANGFEDARGQLDVAAPELLVTAVKLDAYNGLNLAILTRARHLPTRTVLIGDPDLVLQKEAERECAVYLLAPLQHATFLSAVTALLDVQAPTRRTPRKRVDVDAVVDGVTASVIDVSHGGLCLAVENADTIAFPPFFTLRITHLDLSWRVQRVWTSRAFDNRRTLLCGARLPGAPDHDVAWRALVDALPERLPLPLEAAR